MVVALIDNEIISLRFPVLINRLRIVPFNLGSKVAGLFPGLNIDSSVKLNSTWIDT